MGAQTPLGVGVETFWRRLMAGECGVDEITLFDGASLPCRIGAEVKDFSPLDFLPRKLVRETDRFIHFALVAADMAFEGAGIAFDSEDLFNVGVVFGTTTGGIITVTEEQTKYLSSTRARVGPHFMPKMLPNMAAAQIAIRHGLQGPSLTLSTACATGTDTIALALNLLQAHEADVILAGASESLYCPLVLASLSAAKALSTRNDDPGHASRPFDRHRDGMVMGEGAGALVLETLDHARSRNAPILAEILGCGNCGDGFHVMAPRPDASGEVHCMRRALARAGLAPEDIDYINAHGTATVLGDRVETKAIIDVFGAKAFRIPVSSIKGATGHMIAAAGAVEAIASIKAIRTGMVPPTINYTEPDPECDLDYVPNRPRQTAPETVMSNSFGFGGQNASLIIRKYEDS